MKNKSVFTLMLCVLVVVTSELQTAGMMPYVAQDINVNVGKVGILVTFYALGMALGGPAIVFVLRKTPLKIALVSAMLLYSLLEMLTIAHSSILWLTLFRFLTGSLSGAVFGLALSFAARTASRAEEIPKDISFVLNGLMIGGIIGMPMSHAIAESVGWRWSFIVLGIVAAIVSGIVWVTLPSLSPANPEEDAEDRKQLRKRSLWVRYGISLLTIGAVYAGFSFFTPVLQEESGFSANTTSLLLLAYGLCTLIGNFAVGAIAQKAATTILFVGHTVVLISMLSIYFLSEVKLTTVVAVLAVGLLGVTMNPALVARVAEVGGTGNMVTSMHTGVITMGVTVGTAVSSLVIEKNNGVASYSGLVSVILVVMACLLTVISLREKEQNV